MLIFVTAREVLEAAINEHVKSESTEPLVVVGDPGCGKTALLSNWIQNQDDSNINVVACFMGLIHQKVSLILFFFALIFCTDPQKYILYFKPIEKNF